MKRFIRITSLMLLAGLTLLIAPGCGKKNPTGPANETIPGAGRTISAGNAASLVQTGTLTGGNEGIASVALSPDGKKVAWGDYNGNTVHVSEVSTGRQLLALTGHTAPVTCLAFSPDGNVLVSTGTVNLPPATDGTVRFWDLTKGTEIANVATSGISEFAFNAAGTLVAGASGGSDVQVNLWNPLTGAPVRTLAGVFRTASFNPAGSRLASAKRDNLVHIVDVNTGTETAALTGHSDWVNTVAYSPAGGLLASGGQDEAIRIWNAETNAPVRVLTGHTSTVDFLAFSPDASLIVSLGSGIHWVRIGGQISLVINHDDKVVRFWNAGNGSILKTVTVNDNVNCAAVNKDWTILATGGNDGVIRFWEVQ
jgi:WD40 repeat protein